MDLLTMLVVFLVFVLISLVFLILRQPDLTDGGDKKKTIANKQLSAVVKVIFPDQA
ncbi:hypothetical protein HA514_23965 (plasmid) [Enterobacter kobei]|uniref:hypothetical protein n=1 Tax=Enterobacter kobei TaxID=208224 RepID=UPI00140FD03C|nr:hypothetical protein [Enterobacter kobei]QIP22635.1 hypothetical protein HA514_23965 [Enterobacter kobei]